MLNLRTRVPCTSRPIVTSFATGRLATRQASPKLLSSQIFSRPAAFSSLPRKWTQEALPQTAIATETAKRSINETNPLLAETVFPLYNAVQGEHVVPGMRKLLKELGDEVDKLEANVVPTWEGLIQPLDRITDRHATVWNIVGHLKMVKDSPELRAAVDEVQPENVSFGLRISQSKALYEGFKAIKEGPQWEKLDQAQKRAIEIELRDFVLGGVALEGEARERFNGIQQDLAKLSTKFTNNVMDATKSFKKLLTTKEEVDGLPATALGLAAQSAQREGHASATAEDGPWLITLDFPSYFPVMTHSRNRALREELYKAYITRASSDNLDNTPIIEKVLKLRQEKAQLLGFKTFAELSMASKMATVDKAAELMEELRAAAFPAAVKDVEDIREFAKSKGETEELKWWDMTFWAERLREERYNINDEELRPYFSLPSVLDGLFKLANRLFGVEVEAVDGAAPVWHPDVRFFKLKKDGKPKAYFYLDPYSRPAEKRGGAWMDVVVGQSKLLAAPGESLRLPVAHMVCNQSPPIGEQPSLMTFQEVTTLFHEFGHAMQHMCTSVDEGMVSGIRGIEWDAIELPSQFMENWAYERKTLYSFAKHWRTGEPLPEEQYQRLKAARNYRTGTQMMRQLHFSSVDLALHHRFTPGSGESIFDCDRRVGQKFQVMPPYPGDRFLCSFAHIFAGGYSAGYYSYKWAEVLSADAFSAFEEVGLEDEAAVQNTGRRFLDTVLGLGGSVDPGEVFRLFRGREPSTTALLKHNDLVPATA